MAKDDNKTRMTAEARAFEDSMRMSDETKTSGEAGAPERKADDEEEARANAEIEALAEQEARVAALARERAERKAKARAESERRAAEQARLAAASKARARMDAKADPSGDASRRPHRSEEAAEATAIVPERIHGQIDPASPKSGREAAGNTQVSANAATENATQATGSPLLKINWSSLSATRRVWHYTCEGDRLGPVSLEELRKRAADSLLDPRLDMVWRKGMDGWTPAGRIDGLFDRMDPQPKTRQILAKPTVPLQPTQRISQTKSRIKLTWPGARRRSLLLATLVFPVAWKIILVAISPYLTRQFGIILMERILPLAALAPLAVVVHFGLQRLLNLGMSRWWLLAACVPALNLWLGYRCFACPPGFACHKKLDGPGIAMAALYWIAMAAVIWMLIFKPAKLADLVGSPLLQKQLRSAIFKN
jgi:hypothetical protein